jgi:hypothetical protein
VVRPRRDPRTDASPLGGRGGGAGRDRP